MCVYSTSEISEIIKPIADEYGVKQVYLFGSYARGEATEESDVDLYISFNKPIGLSYCSFYSDVKNALEKQVDIITEKALYNPATLQTNKFLIDSILKERVRIYG